MSEKDFSKKLSWEDFQSLGNPGKADPLDTTPNDQHIPSRKDRVRIYLEKKGRRGKKVTIIKGLTLPSDQLSELCKDLKSKCGVGGKVESDGLMLQGDQRDRLLKEMVSKGYNNVKKAGS